MSTTQLCIVCLTILSLAVIVAYVRRLEANERRHRAELDASDRVRLAEWQPVSEVVAPAVGATLAVHFDGRVIQGTLDGLDEDWLLLTDASVVAGSSTQPIGGGQYVPRSRVTQIQEL